MYVSIFLKVLPTKITLSPECKCHIIPDCLINMSLKDLQEELLNACKLREGGGL